MMDDLIQDYGCEEGKDRLEDSLWIIGNHSDELTPWIPVVARRLNASGFFILPCCPYDFFKKYQRYGNLPGSSTSTYHNYIEYVCKIGDDFGYRPGLDKLRIPSTKNICVVGVDCKDKFEPGVLSRRVEDLLEQLKRGDAGTSIARFVPRSVESAYEAPKVDKTVSTSIVNKIFSLLLRDWNEEWNVDWYAGEKISFHQILDNLTTDEKMKLKGAGNGLRTLVKSNKHLFVVDHNFVSLRKPSEHDLQNVSKSSRDKIKTCTCYFYANHPQGCPLPSELCTYKHEK